MAGGARGGSGNAWGEGYNGAWGPCWPRALCPSRSGVTMIPANNGSALSGEGGSGGEPLPAAGPRAARGIRILILSAKFGGGHKSTAEAIGYWWERHVPNS